MTSLFFHTKVIFRVFKCVALRFCGIIREIFPNYKLKLIKTDTKIFTTKEILDEFSEVLQRDFEYDEEETNKIIEKVMAFVTLVGKKEKLNVVKEDPEDDRILECAIASKSEYIVTYDKHLLNLKEFRGIMIVKPEEIMYNDRDL